MENEKRTKPNFLIVGAAKSGTTSAARYLNEHPDIFIPENKELRFFARSVLKEVNPKDPSIKNIYRSSIFNEDEYFAQFDVKEKWAGEASVHYLFHHKEVIPEIKRHLGDIPIIIFLRNPTFRAISNIKYLHNTHRSTIEQEIAMEEERIKEGFNSFWYYLSLGLYSEQVRAYLNSFSKVKVILFEDFVENPQKELNKLYSFLNIKPYILNKFDVYNKSKNPNKIIQTLGRIGIISFWKRILGDNISKKIKTMYNSKIVKEVKLTINPDTLKYLQEYFKADILQLEAQTHLDLSKWKV